jgi:hypothetical protein
MPRTRAPNAPQPATPAHDYAWPDVLLLIGYLVICVLSGLTVLAPATENEEEHAKAKSTAPDTAARPVTPAK